MNMEKMGSPHQESGPVRSSADYIEEIRGILHSLKDSHPDAYEISGGEDFDYHLMEMIDGVADPEDDTEASKRQYASMLATVKEFAAIAEDESLSAEERKDALKEKGEQFYPSGK